MRRSSFILTALLTVAAVAQAFGQGTPIYKDPKAPLEARVNDLFGRMTQDEKLGFLTGTGFTTQPIPRLGVPPMGMCDAGQGVRGGTDATQGPATLFPSEITMASTWDPQMIGRIGHAIGEELQNKGSGAQVLLGPDVNIHRSPLGGRNGESFSEDPYLSATLAASYIQGLQSTGAAACVKHYVANNEEVDRGFVDVRVGERALREIYLPSFEAAVEQGHVWTLMSAYNQINGFHATANHYLLTDVLKKDWGFDGLVMSDWGAVHETAGVINAGNDLEMPGGDFLREPRVADALAKGLVTQAQIDDSVKRILRTIIRVGLLDGPKHPDHSIVNSPEHQNLTYEAASDGIILLKNQGNVLPLNPRSLKSIALIGPGVRNLQMGAAGSPGLQPAYSIDPTQGIQNAVGKGVTINYAAGTSMGEGGQPIPQAALTPPDAAGAVHGLRGDYFNNQNLQGQPAFTRVDPQIDFNWGGFPGGDLGHDHFSVRWTGTLTAPTTGHYQLYVRSDDGCRLFVNDKEVISSWVDRAATTDSASLDMTAGQSYNIRLEYFQNAGDAIVRFGWLQPGQQEFTQAIDAARKSDAAIVFVTTNGTEGEGQDRPSMNLPGDQNELINAVAAANHRTIVILNNGTPVTMTSWLNNVPGLIEAWFPGEEGGRAIAAVLFGTVNPSGRLPDTLGARREDYPDYGHFPGTDGHVDYVEGIYVGYRHFDKAGIQPLFPFGYGLSYTTFRLSDLRLSGPRLNPDGLTTATVRVTNTGRRAGADVVELYIHDTAPRIDKPLRELKGFRKVMLNPGQSQTVTFTITPRDLAYCDVSGKRWEADPGTYEIQLGASERDILLHAPFQLTATYVKPVQFMADTPRPTE